VGDEFSDEEQNWQGDKDFTEPDGGFEKNQNMVGKQ
jgi:hypothetical protein